MGETTGIEWADFTLNTAWGCTKVSPGCEKCYMFRLSYIFRRDPSFNPRPFENIVRDLNKIKKPSICFLNSMTDTFHEDAETELIEEWFKILQEYNQHTYIVLTKRINKAFNYFKTHKVPDNVWLGTSIENKAALHRLEKLKKIDARVRFVSFEPLLEDMGPMNLEGIQWVIVGGESDNKDPRPFKEDWGLNILNQCRKHKIPFFFKQTGGKKKNERGVWGTDLMFDKRYLEMPKLLSSKESKIL